MANTIALTKRPSWNALQNHFNSIHSTHLRDLFASDPSRGEHLTLESLGIYLDYSKNRLTADTLKLLFELANECDLTTKIAAMFRGDRINITEDRSVLHIALRSKPDATILVDGINVVPRRSRSVGKDDPLLQSRSKRQMARPYRVTDS